MEHDFYEEEPLVDDVAISSSNIDDRAPDSEGDAHVDATMSLDPEIKKLELQKLELLSSQRRRQCGQHAHAQYSGGSAQHGQGHGSERLEQDTVMCKEDSELRSRIRKVELQQQLGVREREHRGKKRYTVEVDMKGHPCGQNRPLWMTCLRDHAQDVDFNVDNYDMHNTTILLSIKQRIDNTFDYKGGLGRVTEEAFHSLLKNQLKTKRYQLKNALLAGRTKPKHIRQDHWVSLSKLIVEERKVKEAEKLRESRTQLKRPSISARDSDGLAHNLVSFGPSTFV
jgi:hypothetical protein